MQVLPRNRLGHDEGTTGKHRKRKRLLVFSNASRIGSEIERSCAAAFVACGVRQFCEELFYEND